jgi:ATP-dependent DNA ligase
MAKEKAFAPNLAPNELIPASEIKNIHEYLESDKLDGIRVIFKDGEMISRSLKMIPNKQLQERFQHLKDFTLESGMILDGEIFSPLLDFNTIQGLVMSDDLTKEKTVKERTKKGLLLEVPEHLEFYCFDTLIGIQKMYTDMPFELRLKNRALIKDKPYVKLVENFPIIDAEHLNTLFEEAITRGLEGKMVRHRQAPYKFGRATLKEATFIKFKPYEDFDSKIIGFVQETRAKEGSEKKTNELGRSVTSKKMEDREPIEALTGFIVVHNGHEMTVSCSSMNHAERREAWAKRDSLLGKWIQWEGMVVGSKDVPRHPKFKFYRYDKE